jgi:hypothetical protein
MIMRIHKNETSHNCSGKKSTAGTTISTTAATREENKK